MPVHVHLVVPDLFLPAAAAGTAAGHGNLPALEKMLARAELEKLPAWALEAMLAAMFGVEDSAIAPLTLRADGLEPGGYYWLRADPVHLQIEHDRLILQPVAALALDEAAQLCASLNEHFVGEGLHFAAPHPQRWYLRLDQAPQISTTNLSEAVGKDVRGLLPQGAEALRWHGVLNEIQMLLFAHPLNQARDARGEEMVNSIWLWGGGHAPVQLLRPAERLYSDEPLAIALAAEAGIDHAPLPAEVRQIISGCNGKILIVWNGMHSALQRGDLRGWSDALRNFEQGCVQPLLRALGSGQLGSITLDSLQQEGAWRLVLTRRMLWKFWRRRNGLPGLALV